MTFMIDSLSRVFLYNIACAFIIKLVVNTSHRINTFSIIKRTATILIKYNGAP